MTIVTMVLVLVAAVVASAFAARLLPLKIPLPLLQIALGALLAGGFGYEVGFDPQLFLLLFIPPLLFLDGWRIPKGAFFHDWRPILALAIGLVVFTVVGLGSLIHWMIPAVPLAVAFALAAILSPTDPVAVSAMTANAPIPSRLMHILEGEALLNDASGLVCFSFAVTAALTGTFSLADASISFVLVAGGGVLAGVAVTWAIAGLNRLLVRRAGEEPPTQILISLLIPFAAYLVAEQLHASGILAAAAAGVAMHRSELSGRRLGATRMQRNAVWNTVQNSLNGIIFVVLGAQLPPMLARLPAVAAGSGAGSAWGLLGVLLAITLALAALRFFWVWLAMWATVFRAGLRGRPTRAPQLRLVAVTAVAGVRGAVTLAGILTLPLLLADGRPFPERELVIFLAMGVILLSLLVASIGLPLLTRSLHELPQPQRGDIESSARIAAAEAATRRVEKLLAQPPADALTAEVRPEAAQQVLNVYRRRLDYGHAAAEDSQRLALQAELQRQLRLEALRAERDELYRLRRTHAIDDTLHRQLVREIDLMEESLAREPLS